MIYAKLSICPGEWDTQTPLWFWETNGSFNLGQTSGPYNNQQKLRICRILGIAVPADHRVKLKVKRRISTWTLLRNWKTVEYENDYYTNCFSCSWYCHWKINKEPVGLGNNRTRKDHPNYCIIENGQNTEKSPRDLGRLAVSQTSVKNHQLTLMWKTNNDNQQKRVSSWCNG